MNGVVSMAELLRETPLNEEQQMFANTIRSSGEALLVIINDILDFSKIEARKLVLQEESFDLNALLREIFRLLEPSIGERKLELVLDYDIFLPRRLIGDPGRIRQILINLIGNAVKFTEKGNVTVHVMAMPTLDPGDTLEVSVVVEDTGAGIAADKQAHVFGEFNQVEDEQNRRHDGTGLGLAITKRLIDLMNGEMWLESELGKGSAFGFKIALKADPEGDDGPVAGLPLEKSRVLLIGQCADLEAQLFAALGRLHAETTQIRRPPTPRDLEGTAAVVLCDQGIDAEQVSAALDEGGFNGPRLCLQPTDHTSEGFESCAMHEGLAAFRGQLLWEAPEAENRAAERAEKKPDKPLRLLAAEDNKTNQLVFKAMLKGLELDLEIANNGVELVDAYKRDVPDLVMTDISMPELDGLEASQQIRAYEAEQGLPRVQIIAMTAHAVEGDRERILAAGLDDYITKPLKKDVIHSKIEAAFTDG